jgi:streptogramin lyase
MTTRLRSFSLFAVVVTVALLVSAVGALHAQQPAAISLTGKVRSAAEGPMEGVLVTVRAAGATYTTTVVTDANGAYRFPAARVAPGTYTVAIRAGGYVLGSPASVAVTAGKTTRDDLQLRKTNDLEDQLSNGDWLASMPGTDAQKTMLLDCTGCHTLQRIIDSYHTAAEFRDVVLPRMAGYANNSYWLKPQAFKVARAREGYGFPPDLPAYLASINQSTGTRTWPLKTLPRPTGASTHVIITTYDLPTRLAQPHDVIGTSDGSIWYSDFGQEYLGRLNPKTARVIEYPVPQFKPGYIAGGLELDADPAGYLWLANMFQGGIIRFDPRTKAFTQFAVAPAAHPDFTQESMVMPVHDNVDGKVWTNNQDDHSFRRLDAATGTWESFGPYYYPNSTTHMFNSYGLLSDKANTLWLLDFGGGAIAHLDPAANTFKVISTPTAMSRPRRGRVDDRTGLFWFAEFAGNNVGSYDTKADDGVIKEYPMPTKFDAPYDAVADKNGDVWTASMITDHVARLDPSTRQVVEYLMPIETNSRRVWVDNSTNPVTLWTGANHQAAIVRVEPTQ